MTVNCFVLILGKLRQDCTLQASLGYNGETVPKKMEEKKEGLLRSRQMNSPAEETARKARGSTKLSEVPLPTHSYHLRVGVMKAGLTARRVWPN